jgi:hypothetical protein
MRTQEFFLERREMDGGHLGRRRKRVESGPGRAVPDIDRGVVGTASRGQEGGLPRAPCDRLYVTTINNRN